MLSTQYTNNDDSNNLREIISSLFVENMAKYKPDHMTQQEFQQDIHDLLLQCEPKIIDTLKNYKSMENSLENSNPISPKLPSLTPLTYLCCIDGSDTADLAYKTMIHLRRKFDQIILFHAYSLEKEKTRPPSYRSHYIRERYESQLISLMPSSRYHFLWIERINNMTAFDVLSKCVEISQSPAQQESTDLEKEHNQLIFPTPQLPDFIFLGYTGRKGPKEQSSTMGNTVKSILNKIPISCIIVKSVPSNPLSHRYVHLYFSWPLSHSYSPPPSFPSSSPLSSLLPPLLPPLPSPPPSLPSSSRYIYAINHSDACKSGYLQLLKLLNPRDILEIIYCLKEEDNTQNHQNNKQNLINHNEIQQYYEHQFHDNYVNSCKFITIYAVGNMTIKERLVEYVENHEEIIDFFVLAPKITVNILSSMSEYLIQEIKSSIVLVR